MRTLIFCSIGFLSSCITITPTAETHAHVTNTRYHSGPIQPLISPPNAYNYIAPIESHDLTGATRYVQDLITYGEYVRNHLKYVARKYDIDLAELKLRCDAHGPTAAINLPTLPDVSNVSDDELSMVLIEYIEAIHTEVNRYNRETISLRERICVD